ncbi:MAG: hypothetical protein A3C90_02900 [Candidatus Magasanikbacteria bacterium RIFCSPHIGHO2_02_FULL_51_14]|uniref:Uncharacterized protein n=1 Tax=Candidatus Magasanikbacteria bacterium RIFCSPHIGHO2_02_FULL_51_14 TaxID=1798683 RepID=A0A1F6MGR2_9BACT|nr:MAG: hypothetical protein A3C90_02900 [Candidatus Magasanikbacteria bacterium RIFCSPHIGHO2_02_FULL_51_14]
MKTLFFSTILFFLVIPSVASAQIDSRCFARDDCIDERSKLNERLGYGLTVDQIAGGFVREGADCPAQMFSSIGGAMQDAGYCLPVSSADVKITVGGRQRFGNVAEYIAFIYKYSFIVGAVLAVLMIIVAGFQYVVSAGDTTKITSAKKRISGAIMGLVLLATSYTILNTINPALVQLRLPNIWMVRGEQLSPQCADLPANVPLALAREQGADAQTPFSEQLFTTDRSTPAEAACGNEYYISGSNQVCQGSYCPPSSEGVKATCASDPIAGGRTCVSGNVVGIVTVDIGLVELISGGNWLTGLGYKILAGIERTTTGEGWAWPWLDIIDTDPGEVGESGPTDVRLYVVCEATGAVIPAGAYTYSARTHLGAGFLTDDEKKTQRFAFGVSDAEIDRLLGQCLAQGTGAKGYVLEVDFSEGGDPFEEEHFVGEENGSGVDLGDTDNDKKECLLREAPREKFISYDDLKQGIEITIDVENIGDVDDEDDRIRYYGNLGYNVCAQQEEAQAEEAARERCSNLQRSCATGNAQDCLFFYSAGCR